LDDWDRKSANSSSEKRTHSPVIGNTIIDAVAGMHWLTLGCLIEGISPQSIVFPPDLLERIENELDELAQMAVDSFKDLSDLGMQVDSRFSSEIFSVASNMLGHAITAKTAKLNKKLKMIDLQLKKAQLDQKLAGKAEEIDNTPYGEGKALDRNELLKMLASKEPSDK
jgi:hypothetical protein